MENECLKIAEAFRRYSEDGGLKALVEALHTDTGLKSTEILDVCSSELGGAYDEEAVLGEMLSFAASKLPVGHGFQD